MFRRKEIVGEAHVLGKEIGLPNKDVYHLVLYRYSCVLGLRKPILIEDCLSITPRQKKKKNE